MLVPVNPVDCDDDDDLVNHPVCVLVTAVNPVGGGGGPSPGGGVVQYDCGKGGKGN